MIKIIDGILNQKPELWNLFNTKINTDESVGISAIELDGARYMAIYLSEKIPIVPLYLAKTRPIIKRDGMMIMVDDDRLKIKQNEK